MDDDDDDDQPPPLIADDSSSDEEDGYKPPPPPVSGKASLVGSKPKPNTAGGVGGGRGQKIEAVSWKQLSAQREKERKAQLLKAEEERKKKEREEEEKILKEIKEKDRAWRKKEKEEGAEKEKAYNERLKFRENIMVKVVTYTKYVENFCKLKNICLVSLGNGKSLNSMITLYQVVDKPLMEMKKHLRKGWNRYCIWKKGIEEVRKARENFYSLQQMPCDHSLAGQNLWSKYMNAHGTWGEVLEVMYQVETSPSKIHQYESWTSIKLDLEEQREKAELEEDVYRVLGEDELEELRETERHTDTDDSRYGRKKSMPEITNTIDEDDSPGEIVPGEVVNNVLISMHVLKWINKYGNDPRVEMFKKKLQSLSEGRVSYCTQKTLKHHPKGVHLWEAKLTSGDRILYSKESAFFSDDDLAKQTLLVWYICNHDAVPSNIDKIDSSYKRRNYREIEFGSLDNNLNIISSNEDLLLVDPAGNNMLRTYSVYSHEISKLGTTHWKPPLQLTKHELDVVNMDTSVLLLGRGGTGKTYCLCSRMHRDAVRTQTPVNTVFISYTEKLKESVKKLYEKVCYQDSSVENSTNLSYSTIKNMVRHLHEIAATVSIDNKIDARINFEQEHQRVDYKAFEEEFWKEHETLCQKKYKGDDDRVEKNMIMTSLLAWTQIVSFIKGSIEAVDNGRCISLEEYLALDQKRVRLSADGRQLAYNIFKLYQNWLETNDKEYRWDQSDFVLVVYNKLKKYLYDEGGRLALYEKIYVDEVQDLTQAEIGLLLLSTKMNPRALFFAGDTAQSINHGVSFRFEEVRKAYHRLTQDTSALQKVQVLVTNFRSHDGILRVAGKVLDKLNETFKDSADRIAKNVGLAAGQRPYYYIPPDDEVHNKLHTEEATTLILNLIKHFPNLKVLTWDHMVDKLSKTLIEARKKIDHDQRIPLAPIRVYGFKFVKGLEFESVVIVDYFGSETVQSRQKSWKYLFIPSGKRPAEFPPSSMEIELKILYTAITRTRSKLFFVEREFSKAGSACFRYFEGLEDDKGDAFVERINMEFYKGDNTRSPLAMDHIWDGVELAEQVSFSEERDSDEVSRVLIQSLDTFCWAEKIGAFQKVVMLIGKAKDELMLSKFEELITKRRRLGRAASIDAITASDKSCLIKLDTLDCPSEKFDHIIKAVNESIDDVCGQESSVIASKLCLMYINNGMLSNAAQIADNFITSNKLIKLPQRIRKLERLIGSRQL